MINTNINIGALWYSNEEAQWKETLSMYWKRVQSTNLTLEQRMDKLDIKEIEALDEQGWYDFLYNEYFVWKYTAKNRLATTRKQLGKSIQEQGLKNLFRNKKQLLTLDLSDIGGCLETARSITGLGYSGASGLLSLLYPNWFGTVDQFVVVSLREISGLPEAEKLKNIDPDNILSSTSFVL